MSLLCYWQSFAEHSAAHLSLHQANQALSLRYIRSVCPLSIFEQLQTFTSHCSAGSAHHHLSVQRTKTTDIFYLHNWKTSLLRPCLAILILISSPSIRETGCNIHYLRGLGVAAACPPDGSKGVKSIEFGGLCIAIADAACSAGCNRRSLRSCCTTRPGPGPVMSFRAKPRSAEALLLMLPANHVHTGYDVLLA